MCQETIKGVKEIKDTCALRGAELAVVQTKVTSMEDTIKKLNGLEVGVNQILDHFGDKGIITRMDKRVGETNGRVKRLEIWKAGLIGAWAVVVVIFPILFVYLVGDLKDNFYDKVLEERASIEVVPGI